MKKTKKNNIAGNTQVYGEDDFYASLGSRLILNPDKLIHNLWNKAVNRAVDQEDVDSLMDMNLLIVKRKNTKEYDNLMLQFVQEYLKQ
ncbi:hypothetical protein LCGC14_1709290 [marine sediment metagenome]|uniref:Uncharacterized protein n=1 Tax=marine sediment metagenome TaxID=412755 RepID=A0A0F9HF92_9ZZZZ